MTIEVIRAINHVREFYPEITTMIINKEGLWCYLDSDLNTPIFHKDINVSVLEEAVDSICELPFIYQI